jgi:hypothetical protein
MNKSLLIREAKSVYEWARRNGGDEDLFCWCAITSFELFRRFRRQKLRPTFYQVSDGGGSHCFVCCLGYIIDVTARQFTFEVQNIEVRKVNDRENYFWFWETDSGNPDLEVHSASSTKQIQRMLEEWPIEQNPFRVNFKKDWA